jgi:hypothetical protein
MHVVVRGAIRLSNKGLKEKIRKKLVLTIFVAVLLCSVAFIPQLSYCQTTDTLTVTLTNPADQSTSTNITNVLTYAPLITDSSDFFVTAVLYLNGSATTVTNSTQIINATANTLSYDFSSSGTYIWNVQVTTSAATHSAPNNFTLVVALPKPTPTPTETPTLTPTPTPNATLTPTPIANETETPAATSTPIPTETQTPGVTSTPFVWPTIAPSPTIPPVTEEPTSTPSGNQNGFDLLLIIGIVVAVVAVVGAAAAFFFMKKRVNEKSLKRFSPPDFSGWVIKKFNGKPGDSGTGVDGYTQGGQPLSINQVDNFSLADVEGFVDILARGGARKGTIVAFSYANDAAGGKLKAIDCGIELEMLSVGQLLNKRFASKIERIAQAQVTFEAPPPLLTEPQGSDTFEKLPTEPHTGNVEKPVVFVSRSNKKVIDQVKKMLEFLHYDYVVGDNIETPFPMSENKFELMKKCDCAIITIAAIEQERRYSGFYILNSNIVSEINAAFLKYNGQVVLLVEKRVDLPPNFKGLKRVEYVNDDLSFDIAMELEKVVANFKKIG